MDTREKLWWRPRKMFGEACEHVLTIVNRQRGAVGSSVSLPGIFRPLFILQVNFWSHVRSLYDVRPFMNAVPKLNKPSAARTLRPIGSGFCVLIARGMLEPARTTLARSASSTP